MESKIPESWIEMIANQEASGKSVLAWCKENCVPSSTFYYRRKKVKALEETTSESSSVKNEVVRINLKSEERPVVHQAFSQEKIRMIKGNVMFEFPVSSASVILEAVLKEGVVC
ncbi:MAG: hypothetical protein MJ181_12420 [Treponema sp.]|nr:hypothetical protein [Treponema sp.]